MYIAVVLALLCIAVVCLIVSLHDWLTGVGDGGCVLAFAAMAAWPVCLLLFASDSPWRVTA